MGSDTVAAARSGTKITKLTKVTSFFQKNLYVSLVAFVAFVSAAAAEPLRRDLAVARAESFAGEGGAERVPSAVSPSPLAVSPSQGSQATSEWPQFRGNARLTGIA